MSSLLAFRIVAIAEAVSWAALLAGMLFKHVLDAGEAGVQIAGPIHGFLFVGYVLTAALAAVDNKWPARSIILILAAAVPPFTSLLAERHAVRISADSATTQA